MCSPQCPGRPSNPCSQLMSACRCAMRRSRAAWLHGCCAVGVLKHLPPEYLRSIAEPDGAVALFSGHRIELAPDGHPLA